MTDTKEARERAYLLKSLQRLVGRTIRRLTSLAADTDVEGTISTIKAGAELKGPNLWILICSTIIACIGLDVSSPAVIIGAMLISPLMSPILGIGLSTAIFDREMLNLSTRNFLVAIFLTLATSVVYFWLTPFGILTEEMQTRTAPTILDAFVALAGGLAGIIAGSRTSKTNAIPGVAIATALMPPLCTAGFGLAKGRWEVFGGAFYLFFINAVLISLSTYLIVRLLKFPEVEALDEGARKKAHRWATFALVVLMVPSVFFLYRSLRSFTEDSFITTYIQKNIHEDVNRGVQWSFEHADDSTRVLHVYYFGPYINDDSVSSMEQSFVRQYQDNLLLQVDAPSRVRLDLIPTLEPPNQDAERMRSEIQGIQQALLKLEGLQEKQVDVLAEENKLLARQLQQSQSDSAFVAKVKGQTAEVFPELKNLVLTRRLAQADSTEVLVALVDLQPMGPRTRAATLRRLESFLHTQTPDSLRMVYTPGL